jgi:hypothetical protein
MLSCVRCRLRALPCLALLAGLVVGMPEARADAPGLTAREAAALRKALYGLNTALLRDDREETILRETWIGTPSLSDEERLRIERHLRTDAATIVAAQEVLDLRTRWRKRATETFVFWWNPRLRDSGGLPARSPTRAEARELEAVARSAARLLGVDAPAWMPYRVDPRVDTARAWPREDLRWGVWAPDPRARAAVVELVARERGGLPGLWEPLGELLGTCHSDEACRRDLLEQAAERVVDAGHVPLLEVLGAGVLGGWEDPAHSSALLALDWILREVGPEALGRLLDGTRPGLGREELRRVVRSALGLPPGRVDRRVQRELRERSWAARREGSGR